MIKRLLKRVVAVTVIFSVVILSSCSMGKSVKAEAYDVNNGTFFQDAVRDFYNRDKKLTPESPYYPLAVSFGISADEFVKGFLQRYDSTFGLDLKIRVVNDTDRSIKVNGVVTDKNGYDGTYISSLIGLGSPVTLSGASKTELIVHFLGNGGIYTNEEFLDVVIREMKPKLSCTYEDTGEELFLKIEIRPEKTDK